MPKLANLVHPSYRTRLTKTDQGISMAKMPIFRKYFTAAAAFLLLLTALASAPAFAQDTAQKPDSAQKPEDTQNPAETLKVNVNVVNLFFNVKDKHGALIPSLTKDEFAVAEDGKPQTIKYFSAESNLPLTLGILIDSSRQPAEGSRHGEGGGQRLSAADSHGERLSLRDGLQH